MTSATIVAAAGASSGSIEVLLDLAIVLGACVVFGLIAKRLGQNVIVGYLLAGLLLGGPSSLGVVKDVSTFSFMGEVGIALLLFTVGLDLPVDKVRRYGRTALVAGGVQVALSCVVTMGVAMAVGVGGSTAFIIAIAVSLSSTAVVISLLADRSESDSVHGLVTTGMLVAQDVIVVLVLVFVPLLPGAVTGATGETGFIEELAVAIGKLVGLVAATYLVERIVMRRMFRQLSDARELLAVSSFTVSLGAIGACWALDLSPALGGFIAGVVMADASYAPQVRSEIAPLRMGLLAIFFAYVGMLADAEFMLEHIWMILLLLVAIVVGKAGITALAALVARVPRTAALMTAAGLAQLGEFSFAVLTTGQQVGLVEDDLFRLIVSVSLLSLLITPWLLNAAAATAHRASIRAGSDVDADADAEPRAGERHVIVVGAGPAGRGVADNLRADEDTTLAIIELNPRGSAASGEERTDGSRVVFGDAARPEILLRAGLLRSQLLVITVPDPMAVRTIVAQARQLAPSLQIVVRGRYNRFVGDLASVGADVVVDEETIVGSELARVARRHLEQQLDS